MVQLFLLYCLTANPTQCVERHPVPMYGTQPSIMGCMTAAQPTAAEFLREHPNYFLKRWRCKIGNRAEDRAAWTTSIRTRAGTLWWSHYPARASP